MPQVLCIDMPELDDDAEKGGVASNNQAIRFTS